MRLTDNTRTNGFDSLQDLPAAAADGVGGDAVEEAEARTSQVAAGTVLGPAGEVHGLAAAEDGEEEDAEQVGYLYAPNRIKGSGFRA